MTKERQSNFELLRIVAMILIVVSHYAGYIQPEFPTGAVTFNRVLIQTLCFGGGAGNIMFFAISGYFWKDYTDNRKRIFKLWLEMLFYSVVCMVIAAIARGGAGYTLIYSGNASV
ncbi:MAG: acyltransferase [Butyrivibrio sp.]|nr:acyltransferase [Butyrivibrio sp.]